jgi:hypothetical protein
MNGPQHDDGANPPPDDDSEPSRPKLKLKPAEFETAEVPEGYTPLVTDPLEILRLNREHEIAAGRDNIVFAPAPRSRRLREYFSILIGANLAATLIWWLFPGAALFCLAGGIIFSSGLTWAMFFVIEDY